MKQNQRKQQREKDQDAINLLELKKEKKMISNLELYILNNKDDCIDNTFCYKLFEESFFDIKLAEEFIYNTELIIDIYLKNKKCNRSVLKCIAWIVMNMMLCFMSHYNKNDSYKIINIDDSINLYMYKDKFQELLEKIVLLIPEN